MKHTWRKYDRKAIKEEPLGGSNLPEPCQECGCTCGRIERDICLRELGP